MSPLGLGGAQPKWRWFRHLSMHARLRVSCAASFDQLGCDTFSVFIVCLNFAQFLFVYFALFSSEARAGLCVNAFFFEMLF